MQKENLTRLFSKDSKGKIRTWCIWSEGDCLNMESGLIDGEKVLTEEEIDDGLAGRTIEEQILSRINSRINKKLDGGYVRTFEDAANNKKTNALGLLKPAKCSRYDSRKDKIPFDNTWVQNKLDGHHMNVTCKDGEIIAYSSNGKIIDSVPEIIQGIVLKEGETIEGELYHHGTPLQTISSWVKRKQEDSKKLHYYVYDYASEESYRIRFSRLRRLQLGTRASVLQTSLCIGKFDIKPLMLAALEKGYEGLVLRLDDFAHQDGKRSNGMIKVKTMHFEDMIIDDEFLVVNILESKDGWARLVCETELGKQFKVSCHGTHEDKTEVFVNKSNYIGKHVRIQYSGLTKDKVPFHPVALEWREKFEE